MITDEQVLSILDAARTRDIAALAAVASDRATLIEALDVIGDYDPALLVDVAAEALLQARWRR